MRAISAALGFVALLLIASPAHAQTESGAEFEISLVTFGPGEIYWERFGHNAIRVIDRAVGTDTAYNYGIFDFAEDDFLLNFARGRMRYRIAAGDTADDLAFYAQEGRWIVEQKLNLAPAQRSALVTFLETNRRPENAYYRYDYFVDNCSTRVRDALDRALGGAIRAALVAPSRGFTYRMHADRLMAPDFALMLGIDAGLGPFADRRLSAWDESFVPMALMEHLRDLRVGDVPLVASETVLAPGRLPDPPDFPPALRWPFLVVGVALAFGLLTLARRAPREFAAAAIMISLICGIAGLVLAALWSMTEHRAAWRNENLLLLNPLCLLLLPTWWRLGRGGARAGRFGRTMAWLVAVLAAFALFTKILPWFAQDNRAWLALLLPLHASLLLAVERRARLADRGTPADTIPLGD